nr:FecR domain-containing protein [Bryobacter sp.]
MKRNQWVRVLIGIAAALPLAAQDDNSPGRGVARVSLLAGEVNVRRGDSGEFVAAAVNAPLVVPDHLVTGPLSRAELQFDWNHLLRVGANTDVRMADLDNGRYTAQLARGTVIFRALEKVEADVDVATPSVSVRPQGRAEVRVTVREDSTTEVTVRSGEAEIYTPVGSQRLKSGRTMLVRGSQANPEFQYVAELPEDEFDRFSARRDNDLTRTRSYQYMSRSIPGGEELDNWGGWVNVAPYGYVWRPRVAVGWAPYRYGRWAWVDYWGWNWVSYDPFGWAPFHYGRWVHHAGYWHWWPGAIGVRYHWRPALVGFFGWGGVGINVGFGFGWGNIGWAPLAPYETCWGWWGPRWYGGWGRGHIHNQTIINNVNITNIYRNARVDGGVSYAQADNFGRRQNAMYNRLENANGVLRNANEVRGPVPVTPQRESLAYASRTPSDGVRGSSYNGNFYSRRGTSEAARVPFAEQQRGMSEYASRVTGRGGDTSGVRGGSAQAGSSPAREPASGLVDRSGTRGSEAAAGGWRSVNEGVRGGARTEAPAVRSPESSGGWTSFGQTGRGSSAPSDGVRGGTRTEAPSVRSPESSGGWTGFGQTGRGASASSEGVRGGTATQTPSTRSPESSGGWRRADESSRGGTRDSSSGGGWSTFENRGGTRSSESNSGSRG